VPALSGFISRAGRGRAAFLANAHRRVCPSHSAGIPPYSGPTHGTMRTIIVVFVLALVTIAFGIYSEAVLMSGGAPHAHPDPATLAVAHALKSRPESRP
jgi:hypothetical protein